MEDKYNDSLSNLNSDVFDYIGIFLTKQESISLGCLNKQLYIETQKLSFVLNRCKDSDEHNPLVLNDDCVHELLLPWSSPYSYNFPLHLSLRDFECNNFTKRSLQSWNRIVKQDFFNNFFLRLNYLSCGTIGLLKYIPINILFNNKGNFYDSDESREYINKFNISLVLSNTYDDDNYDIDLEKFYQNLKEYKMKNGSKMRKIQHFRFQAITFWGSISLTIADILKKIFLLCCSMSESIIIGSDIDKLGINNLNELEQMFHSKLKSFSFETGKFECNISQDEYKQHRLIGMLEDRNNILCT